MSDNVFLLHSVVIRPGDRVILTSTEQQSREWAQEVRDRLRERFPDVEFTVVAGVSMAVIPGDDEHETSSWPCRYCGQTVTWKDAHACIRPSFAERADQRAGGADVSPAATWND